MSSDNFVTKASGAAILSPAALIELAKKSWDAIVELYKTASPEDKKRILKILGGTAGFAMLLKFLKNL